MLVCVCALIVQSWTRRCVHICGYMCTDCTELDEEMCTQCGYVCTDCTELDEEMCTHLCAQNCMLVCMCALIVQSWTRRCVHTFLYVCTDCTELDEEMCTRLCVCVL